MFLPELRVKILKAQGGAVSTVVVITVNVQYLEALLGEEARHDALLFIFLEKGDGVYLRKDTDWIIFYLKEKSRAKQ